jgi:hypothetical protein
MTAVPFKIKIIIKNKSPVSLRRLTATNRIWDNCCFGMHFHAAYIVRFLAIDPEARVRFPALPEEEK